MPRLSKIGAAALAAFGWTGLSSVSASYLVVAGGGGGGSGWSGGGGAGGYQTGSTSLNPTLSYTVTVGAGGSASGSNTSGGTGNNSQFGSLTASVGGGSGGGGNAGGGNGGSGGGAGSGGATGSATLGGTATAGQGNNGGNSSSASNYGPGGGGGAGAVGGTGTTTVAGNGGIGLASSISGTSTYYAGGGGGGGISIGITTPGTGGTGGGGAGANSTTTGFAGTANTGGGGGGGGYSGGWLAGGQGGSGVVIISYPAPQKFGGGVVTTSGSNVIHTFNTSGTLTPLSSLTASYLIVAGGGAGARRDAAFGGGGGAGGLLSGSGLTIDTNSNYVVTVGAGGATAADSLAGGSGTNSTFSAYATTAVGGGGGGAASTTAPSGGSGGGGSHLLGTGGAGTSGQGYAGGSVLVTNNIGGGGGGSSAVGASGATGTGGAGTSSSISGSAVTYAGGGGGGGNGAAGGAGGSGGGAGANGSVAGVAGTANLGGGGGGGGYNTLAPGAGGSGVVIISYPGSTQQMAGGTVTISGGNVIHTFTSSGYLTPIKYVNNSLRFRSSASAYLNRTPTVSGNLQTWTLSFWVKRGLLSASGGGYLFSAYSGATNNNLNFYFDTSDQFRVVSDGTNYRVTTPLYRDPASWYHIVVTADTTNATAQSRLRIYVNGIEVTAWAANTTITQNQNLYWNGNWAHAIGRYANIGNYFDGYLTEINFIDGQALTPNSFGTFNSYGVWQPITYGGSYGTNGFYLPFTNTTSTTTLGYDFSPNGNNWTTNNISLTAGSTYDSMTDVPTLTSATAANYAVSNVLDIDRSNITTSNGNLTLTKATANDSPRAACTFGATSGKFYAEITWTSITNTTPNDNYVITGVTTKENWTDSSNGYNAVLYLAANNGLAANGQKGIWTAGSYAASSYGTGYFVSGTVIGIALNLDAGTVTFYLNNVSQGAITLPTTTQPWFFYNTSDGTGNGYTANWNFGQQPWVYTPPSGFVALNTYNL